MLPRDVKSITKDDIVELVKSGERESRILDYKKELPETKGEKRSDFLVDITAFANSGGGHILYGIDEIRDQEGKPTGVPIPDGMGLQFNADEEIKKIDNIIRDRIAPGLRVSMAPVVIADGLSVLVLRVDESLSPPHGVKNGKWFCFYVRNNAGNRDLNIEEIRDAFVHSSSLRDRVEKFRLTRLSSLLAGTPLQFDPETPKIFIHYVPLKAFIESLQLSLDSMRAAVQGLVGSLGFGNFRSNIDGILFSYSATGYSRAHLQVFRNGCLEFSKSDIGFAGKDDRGRGVDALIRGAVPEEFLRKSMDLAIKYYIRLGVDLPVLVFVSLIDARGYRIYSNKVASDLRIDRDSVLLPEFLVEEWPEDLWLVLRPTIDLLWQASGMEASPHFDAVGNWSDW